MSTYWEELEAPQYSFDRKKGTARRRFKLANADLDRFIQECFPLPTSGYTDPASIPGRGWFVAVGAEVKQFTDAANPGAGESPFTPNYWEVTVSYSTSPDDQQQGPVEGVSGQRRGDGSGPGGESGSAAGEDPEFLSHEVDIGGEFLTLPDHGVQWALAVNGSRKADGVAAGVIVPLVEHDLVLHGCKTPPWNALRGAGKVNAGAFAGAGAECVLYLGCKAKRGRNRTGEVVWDLNVRFSEKPRSWNAFYRPETGRFEFLERKNGDDIYESTNFAALFQNLNQAP